jgi:uncharacterized protein YndB with AHSA1/START domain
MKSNLLFDFIVNKENNTLTIRREFAAHRQLVWDCHTNSNLLSQWFAPKPLIAKTKSMDFRIGGHWHYAMVEPNGTEYWGWTEYHNIQPIDFYEATDAFSNEAGEINTNLPRAKWLVTFSDKGENTVVETVVSYASLNDLETVINMGMEQGMISTLEKLDELLLTLNNKKMSNKITINANINADATKAWDYYTKPEHITKWNFADPSWHCPTAENDMKVGGKYKARMEAKDGSFGFDFEATYNNIVPGKSFVYTMPDNRQVSVDFVPAGSNTNITVVFDAETENPVEMQKAGWQSILDNFKRYVEAN